MNTAHVKLVTIIAPSEFEDRLKEDLARLGAIGYTYDRVNGKGSHGTRTGGFIDAANLRFQTLVPASTAARMLRHIAEQYLPDSAIVAYVVSAEAIPAERFD